MGRADRDPPRAGRLNFAALREGRAQFAAIERDELPPLAGKRAVHLQCHFGADTLILGHPSTTWQKRTGRLIPSDPLARARIYQWLGEAASDMAPTAQSIFFLANRMPERMPESAIKFYEDRLVTQFCAADEQLARTPYLTGSEITIADLGLYPIHAGRKALIDGAGLKNVIAWGARVDAGRPCRKACD